MFGGENQSTSKGKRRTNIIRCSCLFEPSLSRSKKTGLIKFRFKREMGRGTKQVVKVLNNHNHELSTFVSQREAAAWKQQKNHRFLGYIRDPVGNHKMSYSNIASHLQKSNLNLRIIAQDIANIQSKMKEARYDGRTETQVFLAVLRKREQSEGLHPEIGREIGRDDSSRVKRIFQSYPQIIERAKKQLCTINFNSTYKFDRFNIPLLQAVGTSPYNTTFCVFDN